MVVAILISALVEIAGFIFFYILIVGAVRDRIERSVIAGVERDLNALIAEFNRSAIRNVEIIDERISRLKEIAAEARELEARLISAAKSAAKKAKPLDDGRTPREKNLRERNARDAPDMPKRTGALSIAVGDDGIRDESGDIQKRIVELHDAGIGIAEIAERVKMPPGEIEVVLGLHGRV
jgi:hypothetical protein